MKRLAAFVVWFTIVAASMCATAAPVGDAQQITNCVTTSGSHHVTSISSPFLVGDVGKLMWISNGQTVINATAISSFSTAGDVSVAATPGFSGTAICVWATQDDTAPLKAIVDGATPGSLVSVPCGGYVVTNQIYVSSTASQPSWKGGGSQCTALYPVASLAMHGVGHGDIFEITSSQSMELAGFSIVGGRYNFGMTSDEGLIRLTGTNPHHHDYQIIEVGATGAGSAIDLPTARRTTFENVYVQDSSGISGSTMTAMTLTSQTSGVFTNMTLSNFNVALRVSGNSDFTQSDGITFVGGLIDEVTTTTEATVVLSSGGFATFVGTRIWNGASTPYALSVDGTSDATLVGKTGIGPYYTNGSKAITISPGGYVHSSGSRIWGGAPSIPWIRNNGTFVDSGSNTFYSCPAGVCTKRNLASAFTNPGGVLHD